MERKTIVCCLPGLSFSSYWVSNWTSLLSYLQSKFNVHVLFGFSNNIYITRNQILEALFENDKQGIKFDYALWMDDDNPLSNDMFQMLVDDLEENSYLDGVLGWYWLQPHTGNIPPAVSVGDFNGKIIKNMTPQEAYKEPNLVEVEWGGFGAVLIKWDAMKKVGLKSFSPIIMEGTLYGFSGDDIAFFMRAKEQGLKFAVDKRVKVPHLKIRNADFDPNLFIEMDEKIKPALQIGGWMEPVELNWLFEKAKNMKSIVEIGSWEGRSSFALAASGTLLYCIDTWEGTDSDVFPDGVSLADIAKKKDVYQIFKKNLKEFNNVIPLKIDSQRAAQNFGSQADMVFIDANHTLEGCLADLEAWEPKALKLLCGHDIDREGVRQALEKKGIPYKKGPGRIWFYEVAQEKQQREAAD